MARDGFKTMRALLSCGCDLDIGTRETPGDDVRCSTHGWQTISKTVRLSWVTGTDVFARERRGRK